MIRATTILLLASVIGLCLTGCIIIRKVDGIVLAPLDHPSTSSGQAGLPTIIWFIFIDFSQSLYYVKVFVGYVLSSLKSMPLIKQK